MGTPWPCGIYISKNKFQLRPAEKAQITYIDSPDLTLAGSRNAHAYLQIRHSCNPPSIQILATGLLP